MGRNDEALTELERGLAQLPEGPSRLRVTALGNLGNIYGVRGEVERSLSHYQMVSAIAEQLGDYWLLTENWINLGIELDMRGRWPDAQRHFQQALAQAERLGSLNQQARAALGLGNTLNKMGDDAAAEEQLSRCLGIARQKGWQSEQVYALVSLAALRVQSGDSAAAGPWLAEAERLAEATGVREPLPELRYTLALWHLGFGRPEQALAEAEQAVNLARELEAHVYAGIGLRVAGQAQAALGQVSQAVAAFQRSVEILEGRDPYEAARTKLMWGVTLTDSGAGEKGAALLRESRTAFEQLGARRELAIADRRLA